MKIIVIGDCCIDEYVYCKCTRLCPEAPVPVLDIVKRVRSYGMAGNVYNNIRALGQNPDLIACDEFESVLKTRYVDNQTNHMFIRIDNNTHITPFTQEDLVNFQDDFKNADAVIISDYNKGFLSEIVIQNIANISKLVFLDTKKKLGAWAKQCQFIKINRPEYEISKVKIEEHGLDSQIITTLGSEGARHQGKTYPVEEVEIKDLSGAGDTFLAALAVKYVETQDIDQAIKFANECATVVVQKKGTSTI